MRAISPLLSACLLIMAAPYLLAAPLTSSEKEELRKIYKETSIDLDGKATPELVPDAIRWKIFFYGYTKRYAAALSGRISAEDSAILNAYGQVHAETAQRESDERRKTYEEIMARAGLMDGVELAVAFETVYQQSQGVALKRYDTVLSQLSPEGQQVVRAFAYERIRPSTTAENQVAVAVRAPELFKKSVIEAYELAQEESRQLPVDEKPSGTNSDNATTTEDQSSIRLSRPQ